VLISREAVGEYSRQRYIHDIMTLCLSSIYLTKDKAYFWQGTINDFQCQKSSRTGGPSGQPRGTFLRYAVVRSKVTQVFALNGSTVLGQELLFQEMGKRVPSLAVQTSDQKQYLYVDAFTGVPVLQVEEYRSGNYVAYRIVLVTHFVPNMSDLAIRPYLAVPKGYEGFCEEQQEM
jgi:hypothetical protein